MEVFQPSGWSLKVSQLLFPCSDHRTECVKARPPLTEAAASLASGRANRLKCKNNQFLYFIKELFMFNKFVIH